MRDLTVAIEQLEWLIEHDMSDRHGPITEYRRGRYCKACGQFSNEEVVIQPWERKEDRDRIRGYVAALRVLRAHQKQYKLWTTVYASVPD